MNLRLSRIGSGFKDNQVMLELGFHARYISLAGLCSVHYIMFPPLWNIDSYCRYRACIKREQIQRGNLGKFHGDVLYQKTWGPMKEKEIKWRHFFSLPWSSVVVKSNANTYRFCVMKKRAVLCISFPMFFFSLSLSFFVTLSLFCSHIFHHKFRSPCTLVSCTGDFLIFVYCSY